MTFDTIPEDHVLSYHCSCGGSIVESGPGQWECDSCPWDSSKPETQELILDLIEDEDYLLEDPT